MTYCAIEGHIHQCLSIWSHRLFCRFFLLTASRNWANALCNCNWRRNGCCFFGAQRMCRRKPISCKRTQRFDVIHDVYVQRDRHTRMPFSCSHSYQRKFIILVFSVTISRRSIEQVAEELLQMKLPSIPNVDIDQYESSNQRLGTTDAGPCLCFLVVLNNGKDVFIEHGTGIGLPVNFVRLDIIQYPRRVASHIHTVLPGLSVT